MTTSPYARVGARLIELGYSAIPIVPGEKRPGQYTRGEWRGMKDWERFCDRAPTHFETGTWDKWPDAGVCVALGRASNLSAIDFDYGPPELRAQLEALIPPSPVRKVGAKGYTAFYRGSALASRKWNVGGQSVVEILAHGRQTVLPPTPHPDGMEYRWLTEDTLENTSARELPELPADLIEQIERVVAPWRTEDDIQPEKRPVILGENESYWREINDRAMADFGAWVPELFPMAKVRADGSYRVIAHWRNCERPNVSIHREGITDWGAGQNFTPLDLVMAASSADLESATRWLKDRVGMPNVEPMPIMQMRPTTQAVVEPQAEPEPERAPEKLPGGFFDLGGGALGLLYDMILKNARRPQPILAVGAAIAAIGTLAGRRYRTPTNLRSNVYVVGIADSGSGKNVAREVINNAFVQAGLSNYLGGNKLASGAGLLSAVYRHPAILFQQDEFGMFLAAVSDRKRAPKHLTEIVDHLTELYTSAGNTFLGAEYGDQKERPRRDIHQPCVSIHGTTTPGHFWGALQSANAVDGSLARFLIFETEESYPEAQEIDGDMTAPPELIEALQSIAWDDAGNLDRLMRSGDVPPHKLITVPFTPEAQAAMRALEEEVTERLRALKGTPFTSILARQWEHTARVAMIRAVSRAPKAAEVDLADVRWAEMVVQRSVNLMCDGIEKHVADNAEEAKAKRLLEIIRKAGQEGIVKSDLIRQTHFLNARDRDSLLKSLQEADSIRSSIRTGATKPTTVYIAV